MKNFEFRECEEYEPGEDFAPMHMDPLCLNCGGPKREHL